MVASHEQQPGDEKSDGSHERATVAKSLPVPITRESIMFWRSSVTRFATCVTRRYEPARVAVIDGAPLVRHLLQVGKRLNHLHLYVADVRAAVGRFGRLFGLTSPRTRPPR